jgi:putative flippase GtrA
VIPAASVGIRFGLVGIVNSLVDLVLYTALSLLGIGAVPANLVSTTAGTACSFLLNRGFTFRAGAGRLRVQLAYFVLVNIVGLWVLHPLVIAAVTAALPAASPLLGAAVPKAAAIAVGLGWNFLLYNRVVFRAGAGSSAGRQNRTDAPTSPASTTSASSESGTSPGEE